MIITESYSSEAFGFFMGKKRKLFKFHGPRVRLTKKGVKVSKPRLRLGSMTISSSGVNVRKKYASVNSRRGVNIRPGRFIKDSIKKAKPKKSKQNLSFSKLFHLTRKPINDTPYPADWDSIRKQVLKRDNHACGNCGDRENLHVHHIVPLSRDGTNRMSNLRTLCSNCHRSLHS